MNKSKGMLIIGAVLAFVQVVVSVLTLYRVVKLDVLPGKYVSLMVGLLIAVLIIVVLLQFLRKANIAGDILSVITIVGLIYALVAVIKVDKALETGFQVSNTISMDMNVISLAENDYKSLQDIKDKLFGYSTDAMDNSDNLLAIKEIKSQLGANIAAKEYEDNFSVIRALVNKEIDVAIVNGAHLSVVEEGFDSMSEDDPDYLGNDEAGNRIYLDTVIKSVFTVSFTKEIEAEPEREIIDTAVTPFIVYFSGIDVNGSLSTVSRSDVNVLVAVNPVTKQIALVTTPRDSYVIIPGIADDSRRDKLTHAGLYGVNKSIETLELLYGIDIDYYVRVNFTSVENIVNLLGGVSVYSSHDFTERFTKHHFNVGYNEIDGLTAVHFARERYTIQGGDVSRGNNHIELIKAVLNKAMSPAILNNYGSLLDEATKNMETNMTKEEILNLVKMQLNDNVKWNFASTAAADPGGQVYRYCKSYRGSKLSVSILTEESVAKAADLIELVLNGGIPESDVSQ